ncbi:MAG TPA: response regulator transcription factor [Dehalococcoidia bacterium]
MASSGQVIVVDDDESIRELASLYLTKEGFDVTCAADGTSAVEAIRREQPSLVVLDLMLPGMSGFDVCKSVRAENNNVPIIMLTARDEDVDKIVGLELGADDYLTKPFNPRELVARVKAILRRADGSATPAANNGLVRAGTLEIDKQRREARASGRELTLRTKEFDLLTTFAENAGIVLTREQLLDRVWGYNFYGETRTVDVHVQHVRAKLTDTGVSIATVRGVGYKLVDERAH